MWDLGLNMPAEIALFASWVLGGASQKFSSGKQQQYSARLHLKEGLMTLVRSWDHTVNYLQFYNVAFGPEHG